MEILYVLLVLLGVTRVFGELAERAGQPALVGELGSGVAIGIVVANFPGAFPVLSRISSDEVFVAITDLGIFFLMLMAGLEVRPRELARRSGLSTLVAVAAMLFPLALGIALGWLWLPASQLHAGQALFLGVALAITAVPVSVKVLMDLDQLDSRIGTLIVSAAIIDDVLSLLLLAVLTAFLETGWLPSPEGLGILGVQVLVFLGVAYGIGRRVLPALGSVIPRLRSEQFDFSFLLLVGLGLAVLAEALGMHFLLGAFAAGLFFERDTIEPEAYQRVQSKVAAVTLGFLGPVFFASIGLHVELGVLVSAPGFLLVLVGVATLGKLLGAAVPARLAGMSPRHALAVGMGMNARGAVELIVADVALRAGLFDQPDPPPPVVANLFSAVVLMAVLTTFATPIGLKLLLGRPREP